MMKIQISILAVAMSALTACNSHSESGATTQTDTATMQVAPTSADGTLVDTDTVIASSTTNSGNVGDSATTSNTTNINRSNSGGAPGGRKAAPGSKGR